MVDTRKNKTGSGIDEATITREENKQRLIDMLDEIEQGRLRGEISFKDAMALQRDIRVKLNDKFEMEKSDKERRVIVIPAKHLYVCPHTNRESAAICLPKRCV